MDPIDTTGTETAVADEQAPEASSFGIQEALQKAREQIAAGNPLVVETPEGGDEGAEGIATLEGPGEGGADAEGEGDDDEHSPAEGGLDDEADEEVEYEDDDPEALDPEEDPESLEEEGDEETERHVAMLPGRQPDDPDVEIEVDDPELAERINQLKNGYMRGEEVRATMAEVQAAQAALHDLSLIHI